MNLQGNKKRISLLIVFTLVIILLSSCNRSKADSDNTEEIVQEKLVVQPVETPKKVVEPIIVKQEPIEEVFDDSDLGYSIENNKLLLNDKPVPAGQISEVTKESDRITYHFYDGAALIIKSNGDMVVNFPIRITLLIDKDFKTYKTLYRNDPLTNDVIYDFNTEDNWYTIDYGANTKLIFDNSNLIFKTDNLEINQTMDSCDTIFKDIIISTSKIKSTDALSSFIKIEYEDGNQLTHIIGGSTTFIFKSGTSIESDGETTTIKKEDKTTLIKGEIKSINYDIETGEIELETTEETAKIDVNGEVVEQKSLIIEEPIPQDAITEDAITEDAITEDAITEDAITEEVIAEEAITEEVIAEEAITEEAITEEAITEEAITEEAITEEAITEEAITEEAITEEEKLEDSTEEEATETIFDQEIIGTWDEEEIVNPFRIGVMANFDFMQKESLGSDFGLRGDFIIENEVVDGIVIGLQIGLGADRFTPPTPQDSYYFKQLTTFATFSQEFTPKHSKTVYFYKVGLGSMIPINEGATETPYFKLALSGGVNLNLDPHWMVRLGAEAAINYKDTLVTSQTIFAGLLYKFK